MIMRKSLVITLTAIFVSLLLTSFSTAQDSLLISYQGRLTDDGGNPINGTQAMTFTIYDGVGVSKWTESHPTVQVNDGLFSVILGSQSVLPDSVFTGDDRFLGITIGADPEITPRTQLISSPGAAVSKRVAGDIHTDVGELIVTNPGISPGLVKLKVSDIVTTVDIFGNAEGFEMAGNLHMNAGPDDAGLLMSHGPNDASASLGIELKAGSFENIFRLQPPEPCVPPDPCDPAIEIASTMEHHSIIINSPPPNDSRPAIKLTANNEIKINLYYPEAESEQGIVQIGANEAEGGFIELHAADSLTVTRVMMGGSTTDTGFVRLYGGGYGTEYKLLEMSSHTNLGGNVRLFDPENIDGRELLRIGGHADAASGMGIFGFNPQPEPPGLIAFELTSEESQGGRLAIYDTDDASAVITGNMIQLGHNDIDDYPTGTFSVTSSTSQLTLTGDAAAGDPPTITMMAGIDGARVGIGTESPGNELYVVGDITATGAITELSSIKYKTNVGQMSDALEKIRNLRGVNYTWRTDEYPEMKFSEDQQVGLVAEEVQKVIPQLVHSDNNGEMSVDYSKLTAVLIEAFKEQQKLIEELSNRLEELEGKKISER